VPTANFDFIFFQHPPLVLCFFFYLKKSQKSNRKTRFQFEASLSLPLFFVSIVCELENLTERKTAKISPTIQVASMVTLNSIFF